MKIMMVLVVGTMAVKIAMAVMMTTMMNMTTSKTSRTDNGADQYESHAIVDDDVGDGDDGAMRNVSACFRGRS